jgi:hypothetical protein
MSLPLSDQHHLSAAQGWLGLGNIEEASNELDHITPAFRAQLQAPILVSANALWDHRYRRFANWERYTAFDTALDSGGFVAALAGGYRWEPPQYAELAAHLRPTWWAQMACLYPPTTPITPFLLFIESGGR